MTHDRMSPEDLIEDIDPSPGTLSLKDQLKRALAEVKHLKTEHGDEMALFDAIRGGIKALPPAKATFLQKPKTGGDEYEAVLFLADPHSEDLVRAEEMEGMAAHGPEVHEARMAQTAQKTVAITNIMRQSGNVSRLTVALLGDWFLGAIHPDELCGASMPLPVAIPWAGRVLASTLGGLSKHFESVRVVGMVGNHGRTTKKPVMKMTADRNWDMCVYMIAQEFLRSQANVTFKLPKSIMHVEDIMGWKNLLTHGNVAAITHRTPFFGIEDSFNKQHNARRGTDQDFDYAYLGHFHQRSLLRDEIYLCPCMIGQDQFGQYKMHLSTKPQQLLTFYTEKHGRTAEWVLNLD